MRRRAEEQIREDISHAITEKAKESFWWFILKKVIDTIIKAALEALSEKYKIDYADGDSGTN